MTKIKSVEGFTYTTAIKKLRKLKKRIKIVPGGTSAGKTFGIIPILIDKAAATPGLEISIVSESIPHLRRGAMKDFVKIMQATGRFVDDRWSRSLLRYDFHNGSYIEFFGADQADKLRGARRNILYINECNNVHFEAYQQLSIRTSNEVWLDFNPANEFWVHTELGNDPDAEQVVLTYKDNEALSPSIVREIEKAKVKAETSSYWANWWRVYGLGLVGSLDGVIFDNWQQIQEIPPEAQLLGYGLDFGYSNDPTAIVAVYKWNDQRILDEVLYKTGLVNSEIADYIPDGVMTYADSAEPKSIEEIRRLKKMIKPTKKGKDSINYGIQLMQNQNYLVTARSTNLIKELRGYCWDTDKTGKRLNKPIDDLNHCFEGETLIETNKGNKPIKDVSTGDYVATPLGYKRVVRKFNNGKKQIKEYSMQFDTFSLTLRCTENHKVKTAKGWKEISKLKSGETVYLTKNLMDLGTNYTQKKNISAGEQKECTLLYGSITTRQQGQKGIMSTTLMKTRGTITRQILKLKKVVNTLSNTEGNGIKKILNGVKSFIKKGLKPQKNGIIPQMGLSGIKNTLKSLTLENGICQLRNVNNVVKSINQTHIIVNFVQTNVNQHSESSQELTTRLENALNAEKNSFVINTISKLNVAEDAEVYDLMIDDVHCYYANGLLVHNCIDSVRYMEMMTLSKQNWFVV